MSESFDPVQKLSADQLAGLLDVFEQTIASLEREGILTAKEDDRYALAQSVQAFVEFVQEGKRYTAMSL
jgi:DNA-binding XRE family transcriptional regulator